MFNDLYDICVSVSKFSFHVMNEILDIYSLVLLSTLTVVVYYPVSIPCSKCRTPIPISLYTVDSF